MQLETSSGHGPSTYLALKFPLPDFIEQALAPMLDRDYALPADQVTEGIDALIKRLARCRMVEEKQGHYYAALLSRPQMLVTTDLTRARGLFYFHPEYSTLQKGIGMSLTISEGVQIIDGELKFWFQKTPDSVHSKYALTNGTVPQNAPTRIKLLAAHIRQNLRLP